MVKELIKGKANIDAPLEVSGRFCFTKTRIIPPFSLSVFLPLFQMTFFCFCFCFCFSFVFVFVLFCPHEIYFLLRFLFLFFFSFFKDGATPLFISSQEGHVEVVKELIKGKANIDARGVKVSEIFVLPKPQYLYNTSFLPFSFSQILL